MKIAFFLGVLLILGLLVVPIGASPHAEPFGPGQSFNQALVAQVTGTALGFMEPRTLDAIPIPQLTMWGLRGLTTLDPRMSPDLQDGALRLLEDGRPILVRAPPADVDASGWGAATAQLSRAAWDGSEAIRRAGNTGLIRTFFDELFNHFDPYSRYTPPEEAEEDRERRNGRAGVGITLTARAGQFVVQSVQADSPAADGGVRPGDRVLAVDDQPTLADDLRTVSAEIAGEEGVAVSLTLRGRDGRARTVNLRRALVPAETVTASRMADLLVLRVSGFASDTGERLGRELMRGLAGPRLPRGVVIDLRGNRGGLLRQAVATADTLLTSGTIAVTVGRDPDADHEFVADGQDLARGLPVVVMVDGRSASSAEILAAALADQGRAVVVGSSTLGKGLVQTILTLPDGGELFVTWSRVLAPQGWPIQGLGVMPQVCTSLGQSQLGDELAALSRGHQLLADALDRHRNARAPISAAEVIDIRNACPAAEGRDADIETARYLVAHRAAYQAALLEPPAQ